MESKHKKAIEAIIDQSKRKMMGRVFQKELSPQLLVNALFSTFNIRSKLYKSNGPTAVKARVQEIVNNNIIPPVGRSSAQEFFRDGFIHELNTEFVLEKK